MTTQDEGLDHMDVDAREMYREHILDLFKHPHNFGTLAGCTHRHHAHNPLCGDDITIECVVTDGKVSDVRFNGTACAICMAQHH